MRKINEKKLGLILLWLSIVLGMTFLVLITISFFSTKLITKNLRTLFIGLFCLTIAIFLSAIYFLLKERHGLKFKKPITVMWSILVSLFGVGCCSFLFILYGPFKGFREWLITTAMATMSHQYYCEWFYSDKMINKVLNSNYIEDIKENTDSSLVVVDKNVDITEEKKYKNAFEKQVLDHKKGAIYKLITFDVNGCDAFMAIVYDPSKIKLAVSKWLGRSGQYTYNFAEDNNALLAINGGGFLDDGTDFKGSHPIGVTIQNGKTITNHQSGGNIIGFNEDNVLMLTQNRGADVALANGYRDAVTMSPFLIVNGKKAFTKGNGGWGYAARTAIGQRADGIVLLLVVDSNEFRTNGASMVDLANIMANYGAINAANLDGGTSSTMALPKKEAVKYNSDCENLDQEYCFINDPIDSRLRHRSRGIPTAWIVTK